MPADDELRDKYIALGGHVVNRHDTNNGVKESFLV